MSRYIDADDITKKIQSRIGYFEMYYPNDTKNIYELQNCLEIVKETPTVERHTAEFVTDCFGNIWCGICKDRADKHNNFCPNCGAKMRGEE